MLAGIFGEVAAEGPQFSCVVGSGPDELAARQTFETTEPADTLARVGAFIHEQEDALGPVRAIGMACFGPLDLNSSSPDYGKLRSSPRPGWSGFNVVDVVQRTLSRPVILETDVNGAAIAEARWGAGRSHRDLVYVTVGGGIGGGALVDGRPLHGLYHPEMGHIPVARHPSDTHPGRCAYHGDCLEGLAAMRVIAERQSATGARAEEELVEIEAWYLAQLAVSLYYTLSPSRVIFGGGAFELPGMLDAVRVAAARRLEADPSARRTSATIDEFLVAPELGGSAGLLGALAVAEASLC